jgi:SAM-dependent methyltransferase
MEKIHPCILCNASNWRLIHQKDAWKYFYCCRCGLVVIHPRPPYLTLIKSYDNYLPFRSEEIKQWEGMMRPVIRTSADLIEAYAGSRKGRILDVGCGYGFFLTEMASRGWEVEGIEISGTGRRYAFERWGLNIYSQPLEELALSKNRFDAITLFYVIEHVANPIHLLTEVRQVLKPGGLIFLRWPHSTPIVRLLGPFNSFLDLYHTPYHLYDFSPKTMKRLLVLSGFKNIQTRIGGYTIPNDKLGRWSSRLFGRMGEVLFLLSGGKTLLPGVSKSTCAFKLGASD